MPTSRDPRQLAFAFPEPGLVAAPLTGRVPSPPAPASVPLADRLVAAGLVPSLAVLDINRFLTAPDDTLVEWPWCLPSRLYRYGLRYQPHSSVGPHLHVGTSAMLEHPLARRVVGLGFEVRVDHGDARAGWSHAVDLMTREHWRDLIATRRHTADEYVAGAVSRALECMRIDAATAREVLATMGWAEPEGRSVDLLSGEGLRPMRVEGETSLNLNPSSFGPTGAWMMVHGIEDRWFAKRKGGPALVMSAEGMARRGVTRQAA